MSESNTTRMSLSEIRKRKGETDWSRLRAEGDHEGPPEIDIDWSKARLVTPETKQMISLRLDADVLEFFKAQGKGYQTRINAILRAYKAALEKDSP